LIKSRKAAGKLENCCEAEKMHDSRKAARKKEGCGSKKAVRKQDDCSGAGRRLAARTPREASAPSRKAENIIDKFNPVQQGLLINPF
jgi:hypothetical protein